MRIQQPTQKLVRAAGLMFALIIGLIGAVAPRSVADVTPDELILFSSNRDGDFEIFSMRPDGTGLVQLTDNSALDRWPSLSPDGAKIVFYSDRDGDDDLWTMDADGSNQQQLINTPGGDVTPEWSPNGQWIAFASNRLGGLQVWRIDADGSDPIRLTSDTGINGIGNSVPRWFPDSSRMVVESYRNSNAEVWSVSFDGAVQFPITTLAEGIFRNPAVSPDGARVVTLRVGSSFPLPPLVVMNADGTGKTTLATGPFGGATGGSSGRPSWSPDGSFVISSGDNTREPEHIYVVDARPGPTFGDRQHVLLPGTAFINTDTFWGNVVPLDTEPPTIDFITATPTVLWPPNHKLRDVVVNVAVTDNCDANPTCRIIAVSSNEPDNGQGDGNTTGDIQITGDLTLKLRAERSGKGSGRVYTITVECVDAAGNASTAQVAVTVPHSKGKS